MDGHHGFENDGTTVKLKGDHNEPGKRPLSTAPNIDERSEHNRCVADGPDQGTIAKDGHEQQHSDNPKKDNLDTKAPD